MTSNSDLVGCGVVLVTAGSQQEAETIAIALVSSHLAACVSMMPVRSIYRWQNSLYDEEEWQLVIKTDLTQFYTLETKIRELHSYEVPEIIAIPILAGSESYMKWISDNVKGALPEQ